MKLDKGKLNIDAHMHAHIEYLIVAYIHMYNTTEEYLWLFKVAFSSFTFNYRKPTFIIPLMLDMVMKPLLGNDI